MEKSYRLLVAEDDMDMRSLLARTLSREGFEVTTVTNGEEALRVLQNEGATIDLMITDLRMPQKDGEALLVEARRLFPTLKVVVITGYSELEQYLAVMNKGAFDYVTKPFKIPDLLDVIDRARETA